MSRTWEDSWRSPRIECAHGSAVTVWQYTTANELPSVPELGQRIADGHALYSGSSPGTLGQFAYDMERSGHAITECRCHVATNHVIIGCGVGHDDARFAESGDSMGAYYDSGEGFGGAWWEIGGAGREYYVPGGREQVRAEQAAVFAAMRDCPGCDGKGVIPCGDCMGADDCPVCDGVGAVA